MLAVASAALVGGCVRGRNPDALTLWAMSYEGDYSPLLMPDFTHRTGIDVEVQSLPWTAAHEKLLTAYAGGSLPDVLMLPNGWIGEFAMVGAIAPVANVALLGDLLPAMRRSVTVGDQPYGVPWSVGPMMQFYRRDLLAEAGYRVPPSDWEGWRRMGFALKRRRPDSYAYLMLLNWWETLFTFIAQTGVDPLRDGATRGNFRDPAVRAALAFYVSLFTDGLAPRVLSTEVQDPLAAFAQGYFAVYPSPPSLLLDLKRRSAELAADRWSVARMPGPHGPGAVSGGSAALAVSRHTRRPADAWRLVAHLTSRASELRMQSLIGNLPARESAWRSPQLATSLFKPFAEQLRYPVNGIAVIEGERIRIEVQLVAERVVRGQLTIDQGAAEMDRRVDQLLAKRRALVDAGKIA